jgi:hypothetical protein
VSSTAWVTPQEKPASPLGSCSPKTGLLLTDATTLKLIHNSSGDLAHGYVSRLALWHRDRASEGFRQAAEWVAQEAKDVGLEDVTVEQYLADGKQEYFGGRLGPTWNVNKGELWITSPFEMKIASYAEQPMSVATYSASADAEAELVDVGAGTSDADYKADVKGKIVLTSSMPGDVRRRAVVQKGAAGIVSYYSAPSWDHLNRRLGDFPDQVGWAGLRDPFAFMISDRRARELQSMLREGKPVRLHAVIDAQTVPGMLPVVTGVIKGTKYPDDEILVTAHLCHYKPGANDNASGSAAILEMARTLEYLIHNNQIPAPLRTVRFLWVAEYAGTYTWLSKHLNDPVRRVADLNFDMVGEDLSKTNSIFTIGYTPDSNPSFVNAIMESILGFMNKYNDDRYPPQRDFQIISFSGSRNRLQGRITPFQSGSDHDIYNKLQVPGIMIGDWPDNFYHSSEDTPDKVDPTQLHRSVFLGLAAITTMAYAGNSTAGDLAELSLIYGRKRIEESVRQASFSILGSTSENLSKLEQSGRTIVNHVYQREKEAVLSSRLFAETSEMRKSIEHVASRLDDDKIISVKNIEALAALKSRELNVERKEFVLTSAEKSASHLIPKRIKGQELLGFEYVFSKDTVKADTVASRKVQSSLDAAVSEMQARGESELRLYDFKNAAADYVDGQRSILDIQNAIAAEYSAIPIESVLLYFRAFEKAGVMTIMEK